ncbi:hypothetical protein BUALT_Bualt01G0241200 [Buddleja alternifolia]|uniref:Uncharacterized protein n=1 Tax=Buddleja alternifolia TaxID=168488 RepID=A0AAV6YHE0_9LAMI|nr:hypothetical protein BUALT_Bualt01G0241200 [Buddleja alternifolia]
MALAEARAAWQRTANRCLVQEDAKRAPKLACCSSLPPSVKQVDTGPTSAAGGQDIHAIASRPFGSRNPSYSNLSPNSKWWLQLQPNYGYQKGLMDEQFNSLENNMETCHEGNQCKIIDKKDFGLLEEGHFKCEVKEDVLEVNEVLKNAQEVYFDSESSWIGAEKNNPWWRTADTEELALLVERRSLDHIENCDLPTPQSTHVKKKVDVNVSCFGDDGISSSLLDSKRGDGKIHHRMLAEDQIMSSADKPLRDSPTHKMMLETIENDTSKAQLLEALRHSQTRAREAEKAANQAYAEKDHIGKLVFRQASQLFAYKQWLQLLQLENMYLQFKNNKSRPVSIVFPIMLPWMPQRNRKMSKRWQKSYNRKRARRSFHRYDVNNYAVVFAFGLGLVGAGLLLGWTVGWMIPTW